MPTSPRPRPLFFIFVFLACIAASYTPLQAHSSETTMFAGGDPAASAGVYDLTRKVHGLQGATVPLDVDEYPTPPAGLELEQVHVYVRHGERTPVRVRMADAPAAIPERWGLCKTARRFRAAVTSNMNASAMLEEVTVRKVVEGAGGDVNFGECLLGELTDFGRQNTYNFGRSLRKLYIDRLGFLPDTLRPSLSSSNINSISDQVDEVYFRSTNVPRTFESLHEIVFGLYPADKCLDGYIHQLRIRNGKDENLFGNTGACKRLEILEIGFAKAAAAAWNPALEPLDKKISKYIGGNPVRIDGRPRASGIFDTIRSAVANGVSVPKEFGEKGVMDVIEKAIVHEWFGGYDTEEVRRLGMGRLLSDVSEKMHAKALEGERNRLKLLVHSTHDTTLAGICKTLEVFDEKWPAFTSSITFELFRRTASAETQNGSPDAQSMFPWQTILSPFRKMAAEDQYFVRMRYQNRSLRLPLCADEGKHLPGHPELCTLVSFRERVQELTPVDWEGECSVTGK